MRVFCQDAAPTGIYTLSLHDALPICVARCVAWCPAVDKSEAAVSEPDPVRVNFRVDTKDRKSTRLNSSHMSISYAVFCLKKKADQLDIHPCRRGRRLRGDARRGLDRR